MPINVIEEPIEAIKSVGIDWIQVFDQRLVKINIAVFLTYKDSHLLGESSSLLVTTRSSNPWSYFHTILIDCSCIYAETGFLRPNWTDTMSGESYYSQKLKRKVKDVVMQMLVLVTFCFYLLVLGLNVQKVQIREGKWKSNVMLMFCVMSSKPGKQWGESYY